MVKSADRVCNILKLVGPTRDGLRHAEIARVLNIPSSSLSGLRRSI
ncbi:MAG: helix-turn-helix domain-containing protein [Proteobacteria bacterium]|nr:helix-turn-helix domain-containing protein [Pseudomonadota bacterium]